MLTMFASHAGLAIENSRLYEETVYLSNTDWLTKLWNYGKFHQHLSYEIERAKISETQLSLIMIDVDNFKHYNDTLGHMKGDDALKQLAIVLKNKSRKCDITARYGGEEFGIIMPGTSQDRAGLFSERLRIEVENVFANEPALDASYRLTISCGIATYPDDAASKGDLISCADTALYEAKRAGKNTTFLYSSAMKDNKPTKD